MGLFATVGGIKFVLTGLPFSCLTMVFWKESGNPECAIFTGRWFLTSASGTVIISFLDVDFPRIFWLEQDGSFHCFSPRRTLQKVETDFDFSMEKKRQFFFFFLLIEKKGWTFFDFFSCLSRLKCKIKYTVFLFNFDLFYWNSDLKMKQKQIY